MAFLFPFLERKIHKGVWNLPIEVDSSILKSENEIKQDGSKLSCVGSATHNRASCYHENKCYGLDISSIATPKETPLNPVNCHIKKEVDVTNKGKKLLDFLDLQLAKGVSYKKYH